MSSASTQKAARIGTGQSGQALVLFAVMIMATMGMLALGIDLALVVGGQRRFDQNGADAAAMAVGQRLAKQAYLSNSDNLVHFSAADEYVYGLVRRYAGLRPGTTDWASSDSTGINQSVGLTTRAKLAATLEYWGTNEWGATWCYSPTGPRPLRNPPPGICTLDERVDPVTGDVVKYVPVPSPVLPFKVRVTVSSTVNGYFSRAIGIGDGGPDAPLLTDSGAAACIRPQRGTETGSTWTWTPLTLAEAPGRTTCAHAVVVIAGQRVSSLMPPLLPITVNDCHIGTSDGAPYDLWEANPRDYCAPGNPPTGSFKQMLDFSDEPTWCNGDAATNYDYIYGAFTPPEAECGGTDSTWNRGGYEHDALHPGGENVVADVTYWVSRGGYPGKVRPDSCLTEANGKCLVYNTDGNWFPTYVDSSPDQSGNHGNEIAKGFYCQTNQVTDGGNGCDPSVNPTGTYFFAKNELIGKPNGSGRVICPDDVGEVHGYGCRDVSILTWRDPQANSAGVWVYQAGDPQRVRGRRLFRFRLYCEYDGNGNCTKPPSYYTSDSSSIVGRFYSQFEEGPSTNGPVSPEANTANFER
ncbi:MAG: hypothetical protein HY332_04465 [Chloroflexi bacterium]|nr:hypothetical protein [Chloroflexota bacterium]